LLHNHSSPQIILRLVTANPQNGKPHFALPAQPRPKVAHSWCFLPAFEIKLESKARAVFPFILIVTKVLLKT
jgi:hypothetical protein